VHHEPEGAPVSEPDPWRDLRAYTAARLALGRSGSSLPTDELLRFGLAHAQARDAVQRRLDPDAFALQLQEAGMPALQVTSAAIDRTTFLLRPDLGRRLSPASRELLRSAGPGTDEPQAATAGIDLLLIVADGLSAPAIERNALPMLDAIRRMAPDHWRVGPVIVATQGRVALGDEIGEVLGAGLVAMLIGERPGLSSPDSLGIYLTWQPRVGRNDAERNCISNIRPEGLSYDAAAHRLWWLSRQARQLQLTGVQLKDRSGENLLTGAEQMQRIQQDGPRPI
jgi:ethanolamine ammonia-lyase small subunit